MRCSSFSAVFSDYIEGTLGPARRTTLETHLAGCTACSALLAELRVVDALLLTAQLPIEPAPNFTFKVMAEVRAMPAPPARRTPVLRVLAAYLVFAWCAIAAWYTIDPAGAAESLGALRQAFDGYRAALATLGTALSHVFGFGVYSVTASVWAILSLDLIATGTTIALYFVVRPRLLARLSAPQEIN